MILHCAAWLYAWLLRLYPHHFRAEFGAEMQRVFADMVNDAASRGRVALMKVCARAVWDLGRRDVCARTVGPDSETVYVMAACAR